MHNLAAKMPRGLTCICRDTGMCHCFGYVFWVAPGFLGTFLGYSEIFRYHFLAIPGFSGIIFFLAKFDFFKNIPDFLVLIRYFINDIVQCCLQGSCFLFS